MSDDQARILTDIVWNFWKQLGATPHLTWIELNHLANHLINESKQCGIDHQEIDFRSLIDSSLTYYENLTALDEELKRLCGKIPEMEAAYGEAITELEKEGEIADLETKVSRLEHRLQKAKEDVVMEDAKRRYAEEKLKKQEAQEPKPKKEEATIIPVIPERIQKPSEPETEPTEEEEEEEKPPKPPKKEKPVPTPKLPVIKKEKEPPKKEKKEEKEVSEPSKPSKPPKRTRPVTAKPKTKFEIANEALLELYRQTMSLLEEGIKKGNANAPLGIVAFMAYVDLLHGGAYTAPITQRPFFMADKTKSQYYSEGLVNQDTPQGFGGRLASVLGGLNSGPLVQEVFENANVPHVFPKLLSDEMYANLKAIFAYFTTSDLMKKASADVKTIVEAGATAIESTTKAAESAAKTATDLMPLLSMLGGA